MTSELPSSRSHSCTLHPREVPPHLQHPEMEAGQHRWLCHQPLLQPQSPLPLPAALSSSSAFSEQLSEDRESPTWNSTQPQNCFYLLVPELIPFLLKSPPVICSLEPFQCLQFSLVLNKARPADAQHPLHLKSALAALQIQSSPKLGRFSSPWQASGASWSLLGL